MYTQNHLTSSVIMVQPHDFGYNAETGIDNEFQHQSVSVADARDVTQRALVEFDGMVSTLSNAGVEVLVLGKPDNRKLLPDAVFPNNWFSTTQDGRVFIFPMKTENRQAEVQIEQLKTLFDKYAYNLKQLIDLRNLKLNSGSQVTVLEGTGSLIFHHRTGSVFAALSERCDKHSLQAFCEAFDYRQYCFSSKSRSGKPVYHTNVLMSCGEDFAVISKQSLVAGSDANLVIDHLHSCVSDVITITEQQMTESFCGNILQLEGSNKQPLIIMSESAMKGFSRQQLSILEKHGSLISCSIPTIEYVGGGSARCMLAENFLPK